MVPDRGTLNVRLPFLTVICSFILLILILSKVSYPFFSVLSLITQSVCNLLHLSFRRKSAVSSTQSSLLFKDDTLLWFLLIRSTFLSGNFWNSKFLKLYKILDFSCSHNDLVVLVPSYPRSHRLLPPFPSNVTLNSVPPFGNCSKFVPSLYYTNCNKFLVSPMTHFTPDVTSSHRCPFGKS